MSASVRVSGSLAPPPDPRSDGRFRGVIPFAGLKRSIWAEVSGTSKERGAVGFTDLGGLLLNQLL